MYCKYCGKEIEMTARFCSSCGKLLDKKLKNSINRPIKIGIILGGFILVGGLALSVKLMIGGMDRETQNIGDLQRQESNTKNIDKEEQEIQYEYNTINLDGINLGEYCLSEAGSSKTYIMYDDNGNISGKATSVIHNPPLKMDNGVLVIEEALYANSGVNYIKYETSEEFVKINYTKSGGYIDTSESIQLSKAGSWLHGEGFTRSIIAVNQQVNTSAGVFDNCIQVLEMKEGGVPNRLSYAPNLGLIKAEWLLSEDVTITTADVIVYKLPEVIDDVGNLEISTEYQEVNSTIEQALQILKDLNGDHLQYFIEKGVYSGYLIDGIPSEEFYCMCAMNEDKSIDDRFYVHMQTGKAYIEKVNGTVRDLETGELVTKVKSIYEPEQNMSLNYINDEYGFTLLLPKSWQERYEVIESSWYAGADKTIDFNCVINGVDYGNIFSLIVLDGGDGAIGGLLTLVGSTNSKDIAISYVKETSQLALENEKVLDTLSTMINDDVPRIIKSFQVK